MATEQSRESRSRLRLAAAASGAAFSVLALIAFLLALGPDNSTGVAVLDYYVENDAAVKWQAMLFGLAGFAFLWFFGTFARTLGAHDGAGRHAGVILASAGATAALYFVGVGGWLALANAYGDAPGLAGAAPFAFADAAVLWNISDAAFALSNFTAAALLAGVSVAIFEARSLAAWTGWAAAAVAAFLLVQGALQILADSDVLDALGIVAFVAFLAWVFLASALLTQEARRAADGG